MNNWPTRWFTLIRWASAAQLFDGFGLGLGVGFGLGLMVGFGAGFVVGLAVGLLLGLGVGALLGLAVTVVRAVAEVVGRTVPAADDGTAAGVRTGVGVCVELTAELSGEAAVSPEPLSPGAADGTCAAQPTRSRDSSGVDQRNDRPGRALSLRVARAAGSRSASLTVYSCWVFGGCRGSD